MVAFRTPSHHHVSNAGRFLTAAFGLLTLFGSVSASALPAPPELTTNVVDLQSSYTFNCYSPGKACRGSGDTSGGGSSTEGCTPISANGCSQYSFNGGGQFKLCVYDNRGCTGNTVTSVNGGSVTCLGIQGAGGYKVIRRDTNC